MVEPHVNKIIKAVNTLVVDIKPKSFRVDKIILFGSVVKNKLKPTSDVDFCIVLRDGDTYENDGLHAADEVMGYLSNCFKGCCDVDYVVCHQQNLNSRDRVYGSIAKEGWVLWQRIGT